MVPPNLNFSLFNKTSSQELIYIEQNIKVYYLGEIKMKPIYPFGARPDSGGGRDFEPNGDLTYN